jgi:hypothetical protein
VRLKPDTVVVHETDKGDRYPEQLGNDRRDMVEHPIRGRIEDLIPRQCIQSLGLILWEHGVQVRIREATTTCRSMRAENRILTNSRSPDNETVFRPTYCY